MVGKAQFLLRSKCFWSLLVLVVSAKTKLSAQSQEHVLLGEHFHLKVENDSVWAEHSGNGYEVKLKLIGYTDFNSDGLGDLITVDTSSCGNWGDCIYTFFLQQTDTSYFCLFSDYLYRFEELPVHTGSIRCKWLKYGVYERTDKVLLTDSDDYPLKQAGTLEYDGKIYVMKPL